LSTVPFGNFAKPNFHQIWSRNVVPCPVDESWKTFSKIFTFEVICPQNLKSKLGQTGTSLRAGRLQVTKCTAERYCLLHVVVEGTGSFQGLVNFSPRRTVAELRGVKVAQFSDFGLFSLYNIPKTYLPVTSLQPSGYITKWFWFFHVAVEGPKGCPPGPEISCDLR